MSLWLQIPCMIFGVLCVVIFVTGLVKAATTDSGRENPWGNFISWGGLVTVLVVIGLFWAWIEGGCGRLDW